MLVLSRKPGESIRIGRSIRIKIVATDRGSVKLGIDAPDDVRILRGELEWWNDNDSEPTTVSGPPSMLSKAAKPRDPAMVIC